MTNYRELRWFWSWTGPEATREQAMNITSPIMTGATRAAEVPSDSVSSFLRAFGAGTGLFSDSPDGGLGVIMSALAGIAAALAVAIMLSVYFRSGTAAGATWSNMVSPPPPCSSCSPS